MVETPSNPLMVPISALRRWPLALLISAATLAVLVPVALGLPNIYTSKASLLVDQSPDNIGQSGTFSQLDGRLQAIKQEALSRQRLTELIEHLDLYPKLRQRGALNDAITQVQKDVKVDIVSSTRADGRAVAFTVSYVGNDPQKVSDVANQLAQFYVEKNGDLRTRQASRSADLLRAELDAATKRLATEEQRLRDFAAKNSGSLPQQAQALLARYTQLTTQLQTNTTSQTTLMAQRDQLESQIAALLTPRAATAADVTDPNMKLALAQKELSALQLKGYGDAHPLVRDKKEEIAGLQAQVAARKTDGAGTDAATAPSQVATLQGHLQNVNARLETAKKAIEDIQAQMASADAVLKTAPFRDVEYEKINRDVKSARDALDALQKLGQSALLTERAERVRTGDEFQILDPALPATGATAPNRRLLLGGSVFAAFTLGIGVIFLLEQFSGGFRSVDELRAFTNVPVLATIPRMITKKDKVRRALVSCAVGIAALAALGYVSVNVFRVAQHAEGITRMLVRLG